jgi:NB-ARC domain/Rx N-terminal domain
MLIAESTALTALGWVASPVISNLINKCTSILGSDIVKDVEDLETTLLPQFELVIQAIQSSSDKKDKLAKWLARLRGAYYDAENILHEMEYEHLKSKAKGEDKKLWARISSRSVVKPLAKITSKVNKKVSLSPQKRELLLRLNKLKDIAAEAKILRDLLGIQIQSGNGSTTSNNLSVTSSLLKHKVFGRDGVRDHIINFLLDGQGVNSSTKGYSVGAITGMGGAGKTTLTQYAYNDERVKKHFGVRMWLCLSQNMDILERTREMIECVSGKECPNLRNLSVVQNKLIESLPESEAVLLVLDDVWYDPKAGEQQWENLLAPFASKGEKCKILITSRSDSFPGALQLPAIHIQLRDLADNDFLSLFQYYAFSGLENIDTQLKNHLSDIGEQIAMKLTKSPLAAKVVGNQLRKQPTIRFWQATLENVNFKDLMEVLLWSYNRLDAQLQRCFLFCSVFPKGTEHLPIHLPKYWVALDFIHASDDNRDVEEIAHEYFHMLVANSIFQLVNNVYIMHDLFHDLAEKLSAGDCLRITNSEREVPSTALHALLRVSNENLIENLSGIGKLSNLRTLLLDVPYDIEDASEIVSLIATNFKNLRILKLHLWGYKILPKAIGEMRNLRYINVRRSSIKELPDFVTQLYHLQYMLLPASVKALPLKFSNLIKLRHVELYDTNNARLNNLPPVPYLSKLTSLQRLYEFHVRKEEGYDLQQLGSLREITDYLRIMNLENVRHEDEAVEARLVEKHKLKTLKLVWSKSAENGSDLEVLEALPPPPYLESLTIKGYSGSRYPSWLLKGSLIENIKSLVIDNCNSLIILPQNFHQSRHCLDLSLRNLGYLRELSTRKSSYFENH